ncbi:MAG TPA: HNH endonuclease signature motif containing protein [Solirubrobacterales bacterium]|nr:HNH endonuclease signature motif containing protein [Solirubrobacterales bacterium]
MDKRFLEECLAKSMSLEAIGKATGKHPSTVSYWIKKHDFAAVGNSRHAPKGEIDPIRLQKLAEEGVSIRKMADELGAGYSTIRYWLGRLDLETDRMIRRKEGEAARKAGLRRAYLKCPKHGHTAFFARLEGGFRCARCNTAAVSERRRQVKRRLVEEAGGQCTICGFAEHPAALQFHHLDPSAKAFHLSRRGHSRSIKRMRAEAEKCVLLCANCHAQLEVGAKELPVDGR